MTLKSPTFAGNPLPRINILNIFFAKCTTGSLYDYFFDDESKEKLCIEKLFNNDSKTSLMSEFYNPCGQRQNPFIKKFFFILLLITGFLGSAKAQISVTADAGVLGPTVYTTLKAAFDAINVGTHQGNITISVTGNTSETATAVLNNGAAAPASYLSVTIRPTGAGRLITGNLPTAIVKLNGADNVTIDGFVTAGPTRDLTFSNGNTTNTSGVIWVASASVSDGATNNIIRNCIVTGSGLTTTAAAIGQSSGVTFGGIAETANSNNTYTNNQVGSALYGIKVSGATASPDVNTVISGNTISSIGHAGVYASTQTNVLISGNAISAVSSSSGNFTFQTSGIIVTATMTGGLIEKNKISNIRIASVWGCNGIQLDAINTNSNLVIANNFISDVAAGGYGTFNSVDDNGCGIAITKGGGYRIHYNSIDLSTDQNTTTCITAAIWIAPSITAGSLIITNNIFANRQTKGNRYAIYSNSPATIFTQINYNDYFSAGPVGYLGSIQSTLTNWQNITEQDDLSVSINPFYISTLDLHLQPYSPLDGLGTPIAGIITDIDGATRNATTPEIGADEFTPPNCSDPMINGFPASASITEICASGSATLSASGYSYGVGISYHWEVSTTGAAGSWSDLGTQVNPLSGSTGTITATRYYRLRVQCNGGTAGFSVPITITVNNPAVVAGPNVPRCGIGTVDLTATGTNLQWYAANTGGTVIGTGSPFTTPLLTTTTTFYVSASSGGVNGSGGKPSTNGSSGGYNGLTGLVFDATQPFTLLSVRMYPQAAGQVTIQAVNSAGTMLPGCSYTVNFPGATSTGYVVPVMFPIPIGTAHRLVVSNNASNISIWRDFSTNTFPYILGSVGSITSGWISGISQAYYFFFDWQYSTRCESNRVGVTAIVNVPPALTSVSPAAGAPRTICTGSSVTLNAVGSSYTNFTWNPGALPNGSVVSPTTTTTYTLTAEVPGGCRRDSVVTITVNATPSPLTIIPANVSICPNLCYTVTTSGGLIPGQTVFTEMAEVFPLTQFTLTGSNVTVSPNTSYFQQGSKSIHLTHGANGNGGIETANVSLVGYTNPTLTFYHIAGLDASATSHRDVGYVEFSTDGGTVWTKFPVGSYAGSGTLHDQLSDATTPGIGFDNTSYSDWDAQFASSISTPGAAPATSLWKQETINLNTWAGAANFKIRFRILANASISYYGWLIDNIQLKGTGQAPVTWGSNTNLFINCTHITNIPVNSGNWPSVYYFTPVNAGPTTYTATATGGVGCTTSATVTIAATGSTPSITIAANPSGPVCAGTPVTFTATPVNGGAGAAYNWRVNTISVSGGSQVGMTTITLSNLNNGDNVTCDMSVVPNFCFPGGTIVFSNPITMTVNPNPVANPISGSTGTTVCTGAPNVLTETPVGTITTYQWYLNATTPVGTNSNTYSAPVPGTYSVAITSNQGCKDTSVDLIVTQPTYTITATAGANGTISPVGAVSVPCGDNITFTITPNAGYSILDVLVDGVPNAPAVATGTYTFTAVGANGHTIAATFFVAGCATPATSYAGPDASMCAGPNFTLSGSRSIGGSATSGVWSSSNGGTGTFIPNNTFASATSYTPSQDDLDAGFVDLTLETDDPAGACLPSTSTMRLTIKPAPSVTITGQIGLCSTGSTTTWLVADTSATTVNITTFTWNHPPLTPIGTNNDSLHVLAGQTGDYTVTVMGTNGCSAINAVTVNIFNPPTVTIAGTGPICTDAGVDLNATAVAGSGTVDPNGYKWYLNGVLIPGAITSILTATQPGDYTAKATNSNGCVSLAFSNIITLAADISPLIGDYTIGVGPASCTNYLSFATAINDLNNRSIAGDVRFSVPADYTETVLSPGLRLGKAALNAATATGFTITFLKSGLGANPKLIAYTGGSGIPSIGTPDGIWSLNGVDNVNILEIDLAENPANGAANTLMEYGYGLFKLSTSDGAQNNVIQGCNITLSNANFALGAGPMTDGSTGILVVNSICTNAIVSLTPTGAPGANSNNKFYQNTISNCHTGIGISGFATTTSPFTQGDFNNDVGGSSSVTGNTIQNFGSSADLTAAIGIRVLQQWGVNISFNTVNNNTGSGSNATNILRGIWAQSGTSASATISSNAITLNSNATNSSTVGIDNGIGSTPLGNTVTINNNDITGGNTLANNVTANFTGIANSATAGTVIISGNTVHDISLAGPGTFTGISNTVAVSSLSINNNNILNNTKTSFGTFTGITFNAPVSASIATNVISNNTITGGGTACTFNCMLATGGSYVVDGNTIYNNSITAMSGAVAAKLYGFFNNTSAASETFTDNIVRKLFITGAGTGPHEIRGLFSNTIDATSRTMQRNQVDSLYSGSAISAQIYGIWSQIGGDATHPTVIANNKVHSLFAGQSSATSFVKGITLGTRTTGIPKVYNNMVSLDLTQAFAPAANNVLTGNTAVTGIEISPSSGNAVFSIYYNTVRIAGGGSGTAFGSSGIALSTTTPCTLDMRNNIISNFVTPGSAGFSAGYRRTNAAPIYATTSNNNDWYTTETAASPVYLNIAASVATLAAFQAAVTPRDSLSINDLPVFVSIPANDLHLAPGGNCGIDGMGQPIATYADDYDATNVRDSSAPDIGADEFDGTGGSGVWKGINTDWLDPKNWCGVVPTVTTNVIIPKRFSGKYPIIPTGVTTPVANNITINQYGSITLATGGKLSNKGQWLINGTLTNNGTIELNGTANQLFPNAASTGTVAAMTNLTVTNPGGATMDKNLTLTGVLKPNQGAITINNNVLVTLHSDPTGTASVDTVKAGASIAYVGTGKFSIERYISSFTKQGWRFLGVPLIPGSAQTIHEAWQENMPATPGPSTGYGTWIVGPTSAGFGFDLNNALPSAKKYDITINNWVSIPGTTGPIAANDGYMIFIRGDRDANLFGEFNATTLRTAGQVNTGNITVSTANANTDKFISVANPYPCAISFGSTARIGLLDVYYLWDPKLSTYGGYVSFAGPTYAPVPTGGSYNLNNAIESGLAFFAYTNATVGAHSIQFSENSKSSSNVQVARMSAVDKQLQTRLFVVSGSNLALYDGNRVDFDNSYSNEIDGNDANKMTNFNENLGLLRNGKLISVERRAEVVETDTIFFQLSQFRQQEYQLEFTPENMATPGLSAWLEDTYLHTSTVVDLSAVTTVNFVVTADAASKAADRFRIVFRQLAVVPLSFTSVSANRQDKNIMVNWKVDNELNIATYDVEGSGNGISFQKLSSQPARGNGSGATLQYNWLDEHPLIGINYYRIKSIANGGAVKYSQIVKVNMAGDPSLIAVNPNPVKDRLLRVAFTNMEAGDYDLRLYALNGQLLLQQTVSHAGGNQNVEIPVQASIAKGMYNLEISMKKGKKRVFRIMIE